MNQIERQNILRQMDQLIQKTNYQTLLEECFNRRMLSEVMKNIIKDRYQNEATQHKKLFEKITKRGPTAYQTLLDICQKNFPAAYALLPKPVNITSNLKNSSNSNGQEKYHSKYNPNRQRSVSVNLGDCNRSIGSHSVSEEDDLKNNNSLRETTDKGSKYLLELFEEKVSDLYKVELTTRHQRHRLLQVYEMRSHNRGVVFILNIINYINDTHPVRNGARTDKNNLISLFRQLGFKVFYYEDLTSADFSKLVEQLKVSEHLSTECFAFYALAHGNHTNGQDRIYLHDNSVLFVEEILVKFNNANCRKLIGKPKLFFFSICRGDKADYGTMRPSEDTERDGMINPTNPPTNMPTFADMFICFSTVPGFAAHRDLHKGSWFVESMCEVWAKHAHDTDVEQLMKLVGKHTSMYRNAQNNALQTLASEQRGFFDILYLNPGYNAD
ncbi:caspase Dronc-like [Malaya genurostris]|uniref:caspase Dronc-like n=1 Tax=Malaya genurostris TaxID=325434 RepID=UPI0026F3DB5A|nr:caspase Dronc-like [Malaya genurostris]